MRSIQSIAAQAEREARANGLPCGEYVYTDPMSIQNRYQSEAGAIAEKYGSVANWREWDKLAFAEINTGKTLFDTDIRSMTGVPLTDHPSKAIAALDQSKILVRVLW